MTETTLSLHDNPPDITLTRLIDRHGAWTTLRAFAAALWRRRSRPRDAATLPDHLRRDIGLPERAASARYWDVR